MSTNSTSSASSSTDDWFMDPESLTLYDSTRSAASARPPRLAQPFPPHSPPHHFLHRDNTFSKRLSLELSGLTPHSHSTPHTHHAPLFSAHRFRSGAAAASGAAKRASLDAARPPSPTAVNDTPHLASPAPPQPPTPPLPPPLPRFRRSLEVAAAHTPGARAIYCALPAKEWVTVGHHALRALLLELGALVGALDEHGARATATATTTTTRAGDEAVMIWVSAFAGFVRRWLAVEREFLRTMVALLSKGGAAGGGAGATPRGPFPRRDAGLVKLRESVLKHVDALDGVADDLFVVPMGKLYGRFRKSAVNVNYLMQTYFRELKVAYAPVWARLDVQVHAKMEKRAALKISLGDCGPLYLVMMTAWMRKGQVCDWRRRCLDARTRASAKRAELVYEDNAERFRLAAHASE